ncbi:MAG: ATP-binding cassette domain-containing protein [Desulfobacterales bacterium]|nr:ATP-binding cassette domain-containing protein [Desulfobacterales bacterium]
MQQGQVLVDGLDTKDPKAHREIRRRVGMVFQNPDNQIVGMSVEEDVAFGPGNLGLAPAEIRGRVGVALETVGMLRFARRAPHSLSGGEKRLVAIAGVLAMRPAYVVLDEPTSYLDPAGRERVLNVLWDLRQEGISVIHVTHSMDEIVDADRVVVDERGGQSFATAPRRDVFREADVLRAVGLSTPQVTELMGRLRAQGCGVRPDVLSVEEAFREITALIGSGTEAAGEDPASRPVCPRRLPGSPPRPAGEDPRGPAARASSS